MVCPQRFSSVTESICTNYLENSYNITPILQHYNITPILQHYNITPILQHYNITPILQHLHWLLVKYHIEFKILLLTYKALSNLAPSYLSDFLLHSYSYSKIIFCTHSCSPSNFTQLQWGFKPLVMQVLIYGTHYHRMCETVKVLLFLNLALRAIFLGTLCTCNNDYCCLMLIVSL